MERNSRLTGRLRSVNLDNSPFRDAAESECNIKTQGTCGNSLYIHISLGIPQFHHGTFSVLFLNLSKRSFQRAKFFFIISHTIFSFNANECSLPVHSITIFSGCQLIFSFLRFSGKTAPNGTADIGYSYFNIRRNMRQSFSAKTESSPKQKSMRCRHMSFSVSGCFFPLALQFYPISQSYISWYCLAEFPQE